MTARSTHVIIGASLTGAKAAETLRAEGFDGRIVMFGAERHRPYERPPLSKRLLRGETGVDDAFVHAPDFYEQHDIELILASRVEEIDVRSRVVTAPGTPSISYDRLLLATGARPLRLHLPGADLDGIHYLRTLDDNAALRSALASASRVAVVGAGWIGSEVAASVRELGLDVALIDPMSVPLRRVLGRDIGAVYRNLHASHGVALHLGTHVEGFVGDNAVTGVRTTDGATIDADVVVVGVGVEPRVELARRAGIGIDGGILVDPLLRTNAPFVFAGGDVAAAWHPSLRRRIRVEHWANAINQGVLAAKNMLDAGLPYNRVPYFFSDQYDFGMEYSGYTPNWDTIVFRGSPESREFIAFWMTDGRVGAAMNANVWDVAEPLQALIRSGQRVDEARLRDPSVPLDELRARDLGAHREVGLVREH